MRNIAAAPCEFCTEIASPAGSRFGSIYRNHLTSRIVCESPRVVAMPTIGQIFPGSMLILPRNHVETAASAPLEVREEMLAVVQWLSEKAGSPVVIFEHGSKCTAGGSCGIYHAHVHMVPVPGHIGISDVLPAVAKRHPSVASALDALVHTDHYLLFRDTLGVIATVTPVDKNEYVSQYFRQRLQAHFSSLRPWDWRKYTAPELDLISTVTSYSRTAHETTDDNRGDTRAERANRSRSVFAPALQRG